MKIFKVIYYLVLAFIVAIALLLIVSIIPITGNIKFMTVLSGSMQPKIKTGSIVMIKPMSNYKIGDIITFGPYSKTKAPTTHRIYEIKVVDSEPIYTTKGDANNAPDAREIKKSEILGKVLVSVPYLGYIITFVRKPLGFILILIIPALVIIFDEIKKIISETKKLKRKT